MRLKFGPPGAGSGGWPVFDKNGKRVKEPVKPKPKPKEAK